MTRPNCSSTRNHSTWSSPGRRAPAANRPPFSRAAIASLLDASIVVVGQLPPRARPPPRAGSAPPRRTRARAPGARAARGQLGAGRGPARRRCSWSVILVCRVAQLKLREPPWPVVLGLWLRAAARQGQQQVVMVGDHRRRARRERAPRRGRRCRRVGVDQLDHVGAGRRASRAGCRAGPARSIRARARRRPLRAAARRRGAASRRPRGSSRSGSGVTDSHDARLTMRGRLTPTDHKVRNRRGTWNPAPRRARTTSRPTVTRRSRRRPCTWP